MDNPTQEQMDYWRNASRDVGLSLAYQAGRASMLKELRAGEVELPRSNRYAVHGQSYTKDQLLDYGDRRAAAERERCAHLCEAIATSVECSAVGVRRESGISVANSCVQIIRGAKP